MNMRDKKGNGGALTLVEAVETLSHIVNAEEEHETSAPMKSITELKKTLDSRSADWLRQEGADGNVKLVKEVFRVILSYLNEFHSEGYHKPQDINDLEKIKTIMVLVGEAVRKLDKYTELFQETREKSIAELKEYKQLQEFYHNHIARRIDEATLVQWIYGISHKEQKEKDIKLVGKSTGQSKHVFMDLEAVKKDTEYELFFLRKEDGTRFFSPRLLRNLKLANNFGSYFGEVEDVDFLLNLEGWKDKYAQACATNIAKACRGPIEKFYQRAMRNKDNELVEMVNKALLALFLSANSSHLTHSENLHKTCYDYFHDFQFFLRQVLHFRDYQHMITYPPRKSSQLSHCLINLTRALCMALYTEIYGLKKLMPAVHELIHVADEKRSSEHTQACSKSRNIADRLACDYAALGQLIKKHSNGPVDKILSALYEGGYKSFDPLIQGNIPCNLYTLYVQNSKCRVMRWPSPTQQEFIHKGVVIQEFKEFLRACSQDAMINKCLIFNLQDRTSWKEHFRSSVIEDLPHHESYARSIEVVTLAKDTDFYHQNAPYHQENHADVFMRLYKEQLLEDGYGFFFPEKIKKVLAGGFISKAMDAVHRVFFGGKNVLTLEQRLDFIDIFSLFLELKIIDLVKPDVISFMCKDGVDQGQVVAVQLYVLLKLLTQEHLSEHDREYLDAMLYGPALLCRERLLLPENFNRMLNVIKRVEAAKSQLGHAEFVKQVHLCFEEFYNIPMLAAKPVF